jgi:hypothetical protein
LKNPSTKNGIGLNGMSQACVAGGRTFVLFAVMLVVVMPLTEYYWTFDKFLRGGQDLEFGLLALAAVFCLVLVLSQQRRLGVILILAVRRWLRFAFHRAGQAARESSRVILAALHATPWPHPTPAGYILPIQI